MSDSRSILVLSDIHYGDLADRQILGRRNAITDETATTVANEIGAALHKQNLSPRYLVIPGDLTSRGTPGEFEDCSKLIEKIAQTLNIDAQNILITYGNHDVDWSICRIDTKFPEHNMAYKNLGARVGSMYVHSSKPTIEGPYHGSGIFKFDDIEYIVLNSGIECYDSQSYKHGKITSSQFEWLKQVLQSSTDTSLPRVVVVHHHLYNLPYPELTPDVSFLEEGDHLLKLLGEKGIDLIIHGHRHHPIVETATKTDWKNPITLFCAGSFGVDAAHRAHGRIPNTMHVLILGAKTEKGNYCGKIISFEQQARGNWIQLVEKRSEVPLSAVRWFGSTANDKENRQKISSIIQQRILPDIESNGHARLPTYDTLDLSLRCIESTTLNRLFSDALNERNLVQTGKYPDSCIATKKAN